MLGSRRPLSRRDPAALRIVAAPRRAGREGNPYAELLYDAVERHGVHVEDLDRRQLVRRCDIVHVHWPEQLVRWGGPSRTAVLDLLKVLLLLRWARCRGAALVWTVHNLVPHERGSLLAGYYLRGFTRLVDHLVLLSTESHDAVVAQYPPLASTPVTVVPHGHYRNAYGTPPARACSRAALDLPADATVLLAFGQVRRYKQHRELIEAFRRLPGDHLRLVVAGSASDLALADELRVAASRDPRVVLRLEPIPADEIPVLHGAADLAVLSYAETALNSGTVLLALSFDLPVIARQGPGVSALCREVGPNWLHVTDDGPAGALALVPRLLASSRSPHPRLDHLDWGRLGKATVAAYRSAAGQRRRAGAH